MNINSCNVNFMGTVDKSAYQWADEVKKRCKNDLVTHANRWDKEIDKDEFLSVDGRVDKIMEELERKAALMHPDTVISVGPMIKNHDCNYITVSNKMVDEALKNPVGPSSKEFPYGFRRNNREHWALCGEKVRNGYLSDPACYGYYRFRPFGMQYVDLFEHLVDDIDAERTDKDLFDSAAWDLTQKVEERYGVPKNLRQVINNIVSFQNDIKIKSNFEERINALLEKQHQEAVEKQTTKEKNEAFLREQGMSTEGKNRGSSKNRGQASEEGFNGLINFFRFIFSKDGQA